MGWGGDQGVGGFGEEPGMKAQITNLIRSIRTVMRGRSIIKLIISTLRFQFHTSA